MNERCWRTTVVLPETMSIGELDGILSDLGGRPCLRIRYEASVRTLVIYLMEAHVLKDAPAGTHEFARGWLAHADASRAAYFLKPLAWRAGKLYDHSRWIPDTSDDRDFTL